MLWPLVVLAAAVCAAADIEVLFFQNTLQRADWKEARRFFSVCFLSVTRMRLCVFHVPLPYIYSHCCSLIWVWVKNLGAVVNLKITGKRTFISLDLVINIV